MRGIPPDARYLNLDAITGLMAFEAAMQVCPGTTNSRSDHATSLARN